MTDSTLSERLRSLPVPWWDDHAIDKAIALWPKVCDAVEALDVVLLDPEFDEPGILEITKGQKKTLADAKAALVRKLDEEGI